MTNTNQLTIGKLASAAGVGVETVRYYQRRNLLPTPASPGGAFRTYAPEQADRIRFIKRAQELGFSLEQVAALLQLEDGSDRQAVRQLAAEKLAYIRAKIVDLAKMEAVLAHLIHECEATGQASPCPIIGALAGTTVASCHS